MGPICCRGPGKRRTTYRRLVTHGPTGCACVWEGMQVPARHLTSAHRRRRRGESCVGKLAVQPSQLLLRERGWVRHGRGGHRPEEWGRIQPQDSDEKELREGSVHRRDHEREHSNGTASRSCGK